MDDRERDPGKRKMPWYEEFGESSEDAAQRTRARTTESLGGEDGAGENLYLPLFDPRGTLVPPPGAGTPSSSSQMNFALDSRRQRWYATEGQPGAATGASGSAQPQLRANADAIVQCPACDNNPNADQCQLCGREPVNQPPPPPQQGQPHLPAAPTDHDHDHVLDELERYITIKLQLSGHIFGLRTPRAPGLEGQAVQTSAHAGQHHFLQVPENQRCPGCLTSRGSFTTHPLPHFCFCSFCRSLPFICLTCASGQADA